MKDPIIKIYRDQLKRIIASGGARKKRTIKSKKSGYGLRAVGLMKRKTKKTTKKGTRRASGLYAGAAEESSNPWVRHVNRYAVRHGLTYNEALRQADIAKGYKRVGSGRTTSISKGRNSKLSEKMITKMVMKKMGLKKKA